LRQKFRIFLGIPLNADAKVMLFLELTNFLGTFFLKKCHFIEKSPFQKCQSIRFL
jgi:hypothetical protein